MFFPQLLYLYAVEEHQFSVASTDCLPRPAAESRAAQIENVSQIPKSLTFCRKIQEQQETPFCGHKNMYN